MVRSKRPSLDSLRAGYSTAPGPHHHARQPRNGGHGDAVMPKTRRFTRPFVFDSTDEVTAGRFDPGLDVQVVPAGANGMPITIGQLTLVTQAI